MTTGINICITTAAHASSCARTSARSECVRTRVCMQVGACVRRYTAADGSDDGDCVERRATSLAFLST